MFETSASDRRLANTRFDMYVLSLDAVMIKTLTRLPGTRVFQVILRTTGMANLHRQRIRMALNDCCYEFPHD
jgi:hypothetical protein